MSAQVTDDEIRSLIRLSMQRGWQSAHDLCIAALAGDRTARERCAEVVNRPSIRILIK